MTKLSWQKVCTVFLLSVATAIPASAQTFTTLVKFDGTNGAEPYLMSLVQGSDGSLYGTTSGTVFKIGLAKKLTTLYVFCSLPNCTDGGPAYAGLVHATNGNFYGTTRGGGTMSGGTVFKITPMGALATLYNFCGKSNCPDGSDPYSALVEASDGNFYGTAYDGGANGVGTVFRITPGGDLTTIHSFDGGDGDNPWAGLILGHDGSFYGTTYEGGKFGGGTLFKITPEGSLVTVYSFDSSEGYPAAGVIQASDGNFYGTTVGSPSDGYWGTVFKITPAGVASTLHSFNLTDGGVPYAPLVQATDGNLYGTTSYGGKLSCGGVGTGCGTLFRITPSGMLTTLHTFGGNDGALPYGGLFQATNGTLYGTNERGGNLTCYPPSGCGTVFSLDVGLGPFVAFVLSYGSVGQTGGILGQGFTGTTGVSFNGIPASFTVVSETFIKATVPAGATTGYVTVNTPSGTLTSNVPFQVIPLIG
jgi:uncharacterized repeat protein (TIGR03803 family)